MNPFFSFFNIFFFCFVISIYHSKSQNLSPEKKLNLCLEFDKNTFSSEKVKIHFQTKSISFLLKDTCLALQLHSAKKYQIIIENPDFTTAIIPIKDDTLKDAFTLKINVLPRNTILKEIVVRPDNRIRIRNDTMMIDVDSIKIRPHGTTSDLLNNVPGVRMTAWGGIEIMGKTIAIITVNGKQIFGGNAKATIEAIKGDMIKTLEVTKSVKDGETTVNLNLRLKENRENGWYGDITASKGNENTNQLDIRSNRISPKYFFNFFLNENNTNEKVLTANASRHLNAMITYNEMDGVYSLTRNQVGFFFPSKSSRISSDIPQFDKDKGINQSYSGGLNFTKTNPKSNIYAFCLGDITKQSLQQSNNQYTILNETLRQIIDGTSPAYQENAQIWSALFGDFKPNKQDILKTFSLFQFVKSNYDNSQISNQFITNDIDTLVRIRSNSSNRLKRNEVQFIQKLSWVHRFPTVGKLFSIYGAYQLKQSPSELDYQNSSLDNKAIFDNHVLVNSQYSEQLIDFQFAQSFPLIKSVLGEIKGVFDYSKTVGSQMGYQQDENALNYTQSILGLSTKKDFIVEDFSNQIQTNIYIKKTKLDVILGANLWTWRSNREEDIKISQTKLLPTLYLKWNYTKGRYLMFHVNNSQITPTFRELFNTPDSSVLFNSYIGNSKLANFSKISIGSSILTSYKSITIQPNIQFDISDNPIMLLFNRNKEGFIGKTPVQIGGNRSSFRGGFTCYRFGYSELSWSFTMNITYQKYDIASENSVNTIENVIGGIAGGFKLNPDKGINISFDYQNQIFKNLKQDYWTFQNELITKLSAELNPKRYFDCTLNYAFNKSYTWQNLNYPILDLTLSQFVLKNDFLKIGMSIRNIFDVNNVYETYNNTNILSQYSYNRLPRVFMLSTTFYVEKWHEKK